MSLIKDAFDKGTRSTYSVTELGYKYLVGYWSDFFLNRAEASGEFRNC